MSGRRHVHHRAIHHGHGHVRTAHNHIGVAAGDRLHLLGLEKHQRLGNQSNSHQQATGEQGFTISPDGECLTVESRFGVAGRHIKLYFPLV
jgi:hypothetical protein